MLSPSGKTSAANQRIMNSCQIQSIKLKCHLIFAFILQHAGIGGVNAAITYSETKPLPTSGVSNSAGVTVGGGAVGHLAYSYVVDVDIQSHRQNLSVLVSVLMLQLWLWLVEYGKNA